jgi:hypothetical protein
LIRDGANVIREMIFLIKKIIFWVILAAGQGVNRVRPT